MINLHYTRRCPTGPRCECCGAEGGEGTGLLRTVTADIPSPLDGVVCLTACTRCAIWLGSMPPPISAATAARLVGQHCAHLGITVEDMTEQLDPLRYGRRAER